MTPEAIRRLYGYTYWAFERVWQCVMPLTDEQFVQPIDYSVGSIRNQIVHLMSAESRWIPRIRGVDVDSAPRLMFDDYPTRAVVRAKWEECRANMLGYVHSLDQAQLDEIVNWRISNRDLAGKQRRWELLLHVANHATDHRAQILAMLHTHFGVPTVEQDLLFYLIDTP